MTDTTTEEVVPAEGAGQAQPEATTTEAGTPAPTEPVTDGAQATEPVEADNPEFNATEWLQKKGLDPADPGTVTKLAKAQHEAEQKMHQATSEASEIKKSLEGQQAQQVSTDPLVQQLYERQVAFERTTSIENFKRDVRLTPEQEAKMVGYMAEHPEKGQLVNAGYLSLHELYALSGAGSVDQDTLKQQGKQQALQQLANKQLATAVSGAATQRTSPTTPEERLKDLWSS